MRAFMFDLDGTLSNSVPIILRTARLACAELGIDASDDQLRDQIGLPLFQTGETFLGPGRGQEYVDCYYRHYDPTGLEAFPGVREMLTDLKQAGFTLALVTSRRQDSTEDSLRRTGLEGLFERVVCYEDTLNHKPHPEPLRFCCGEVGCAPDVSLYVGDSIHDMECADAAGLWTCGVTWGVAGEAGMAEYGPVYLAHSVDELHDKLLNINTGKYLPSVADLLARE
ncbi:MAG: HAD-IA family hydrolase [Firmicutes bacterium]|nr:HAD-IA family hydrolase [Bacillota bacterium]